MPVPLPAFSSAAHHHPRDKAIWYSTNKADFKLAECPAVKAVIELPKSDGTTLQRAYKLAVRADDPRNPSCLPIELQRDLDAFTKPRFDATGYFDGDYKIERRKGIVHPIFHVDFYYPDKRPVKQAVWGAYGEALWFYAGDITPEVAKLLEMHESLDMGQISGLPGVIEKLPENSRVYSSYWSIERPDINLQFLHSSPATPDIRMGVVMRQHKP